MCSNSLLFSHKDHDLLNSAIHQRSSCLESQGKVWNNRKWHFWPTVALTVAYFLSVKWLWPKIWTRLKFIDGRNKSNTVWRIILQTSWTSERIVLRVHAGPKFCLYSKALTPTHDSFLPLTQGVIWPGQLSQYSESDPSGLRRESATDRLQGFRFRISPGAWMFVLCVVSNDKRLNAG
jgi:hypothetical protein